MSVRRGIDPTALLALVENTAPFLSGEEFRGLPYVDFLQQARTQAAFNHFEYFQLCLSAHYATVATFVPTDVDNQIRKNLWDASLPDSTLEKMADLVLRSRDWNFRPVTTRFAEAEGTYVSGHQGEWFSVAVGAYAAHRQRRPSLAEAVAEKILEELRLESKIFQSLKTQKNGIELLRASTLLAHNLGDLDRVIDQWELPADDFLRTKAYKLGHLPHADFGPAQTPLLEAGALNKAMMASENHRHYPLRKPKCLRRSVDFLLPVGPFFDSWGATVAKHPSLAQPEIGEVAEALLEGFERLSSPKVPLYGYARALAGLQAHFPGGPKLLAEFIPAKASKNLGRGPIADIQKQNSELFMAQWAKKALGFLKLL